MSALTPFFADIKNILEQARMAMNSVRIRRFSTRRVEKLGEVAA